jgi:hypothetical protein
MKRNRRKKSKNGSNNGQSTIFDHAMEMQAAMRDICEVGPQIELERDVEIPDWVLNIFVRFKNTIFKSFLKLKPKGKNVNPRNYGRIMGSLERFKAFLNEDVPRIVKATGLSRVTEKQWEKLLPELGLEQARQHYLKQLNRPANDPTPIVELTLHGLEKQLEYHEKLKQAAFAQMSGDAKAMRLFLKGFHEGYTVFLNEDGNFSGDDRRFGVYCELLTMRDEIEKMRRAVPPKSRSYLLAELRKVPDFQNCRKAWFIDVCDDIGLITKEGGGRTYKSRKV